MKATAPMTVPVVSPLQGRPEPGRGRRFGGGSPDGVETLRPVRRAGHHGAVGGTIEPLLQARFALERTAVWGPAGARHDDAVLADLRARWEELDGATDDRLVSCFADADDEFHVALAGATGDAGLAAALAELQDRIRMLRPAALPAPRRLRIAVADHLAVLADLRAGALDRAARRLDRHLVRSLEAARREAAAALARRLAVGAS